MSGGGRSALPVPLALEVFCRSSAAWPAAAPSSDHAARASAVSVALAKAAPWRIAHGLISMFAPKLYGYVLQLRNAS